MKIVEITCKGCQAKYETLESVSKTALVCPGCGKNDFKIKKTNKEFKPACSGGCGECQSCH